MTDPTDPLVTPADLGVYLQRSDIDEARALMVIDDAQALCETILSPLPEQAAGIVRRVAARCYTNATSAHSVAIGSGNISYSSPTAAAGIGGMYLSRADKADLRRMGGGGGAFTIDPTPADAGQGLQPWDTNATWLTGVPVAEEPYGS